eukprot:m.358313 g.358313  ORF g.358313 m.358313 type:complete len:736 (-) comp18113_c0_seq1:2085-4292(-)
MAFRTNQRGQVVQHSFLGSMQSFESSAQKFGHEVPKTPKAQPVQPSTRYQPKPPKPAGKFVAYQQERLDDRDMRSLQHYEKRARQWRRQEARLARVTGLKPEELNMESHDLSTRKKHLREAIDRAMPSVESGKGFRAGSSFWQQQPVSKSGLSFTLTRAEKGALPDIELSGKPGFLYGLGKKPIEPRHGLVESQYLHDRMAMLDEELDSIVKYEPDIDSLVIVGKRYSQVQLDATIARAKSQADSGSVSEDEGSGEDGAFNEGDHGLDSGEDGEFASSQRPDTANSRVPEDDTGPRLELRILHEDDDDDDMTLDPLRLQEQVRAFAEKEAAENPTGARRLSTVEPLKPEEGCRILFETVCGKKQGKGVRLINTGSTALHFRWRKVEYSNSLGRAEDDVKRFFLDQEPGVILPGDTHIVQMRYLSPNPGVFTEDWTLLVHPCLGGADPLLSLCGVSHAPSNVSDEFKTVQQKFERDQVEAMVRGMLHGIISNLCPAVPTASPIDQWPSLAQQFVVLNPGLCTESTYREEVEHSINMFYENVWLELNVSAPATAKKRGKSEEQAQTPKAPAWSRRVDDVVDMILTQVQAFERQDELMSELMNLCQKFQPISQDVREEILPTRVDVGALVVRGCVQAISDDLRSLKSQLGFPQPIAEQVEETPRAKSGRKSAKPKSPVPVAEAEEAKVEQPPLDPQVLEQYEKESYSQTRRQVLKMIEQLVLTVDDLPPCNPLAVDLD